MNNVTYMAIEDLHAVFDREAVTKVRMSVFEFDYLYRTQCWAGFKIFRCLALKWKGLRTAEIKTKRACQKFMRETPGVTIHDIKSPGSVRYESDSDDDEYD